MVANILPMRTLTYELDQIVDAAGPPDEGLLLIAAFDSALVPYVIDPELVMLSPRTRHAVEQLAERDDVDVVVVSGRRLWDLRARVGANAPVFYAGMHGLEIQGPGVSMVHEQIGEARGLLRIFARALEELTRHLPGVRVENKDVAVALHFRGACAADATRAADLLMRMASDAIARGDLRLLVGDQVLELLPNVPWSETDAIDHLELAITHRRHRAVRRVCLGNAVVDKGLLSAAGESGVAIAVGGGCPDAGYMVADSGAVTRLLQSILDSAAERRTGSSQHN